MISLGECLNIAVICYGNRFVTPVYGVFDKHFGVRHGIHGGHLGMHVQFNSLFVGVVCSAGGRFALADVVHHDDVLAVKAVILQSALYFDICLAGFHSAFCLFEFSLREKRLAGVGIIVVRKVEFHQGFLALEFAVVKIDYLSADDD